MRLGQTWPTTKVETPLIRSYQLRLGTFTDNNNGEESNRVGFKIQETRVRENYAALEEKMCGNFLIFQ